MHTPAVVLDLQRHYFGQHSRPSADIQWRVEMSIYEAIGMAWIIFTSTLATVGILYLAYLGLRSALKQQQEGRENNEVPAEVKEMFKIAR